MRYQSLRFEQTVIRWAIAGEPRPFAAFDLLHLAQTL
jgi:hypothetical protein